MSPSGGKHPATPAGVTAALKQLQRNPRDYVGLTQLRPKLGGTKAQQDEALRQLSANGTVSIVPEDNRKVLNQNDHNAAMRLGGEDNHLVALEKQ